MQADYSPTTDARYWAMRAAFHHRDYRIKQAAADVAAMGKRRTLAILAQGEADAAKSARDWAVSSCRYQRTVEAWRAARAARAVMA